MRTHFGTFRTASAITKQTAERFRLQTANSTRQIRRIIFPTSAFAPSAHAKSVSFPELFRVLLLRFGVLSLRSILGMFFWEGMSRRPPRRLIQPIGMEGNAMVTLNIYAGIEPMPKIQSMPRVAPALRGKSSRYGKNHVSRVSLFRFSVLLFRSSRRARSRAPRGAARQRRESSRPSPPGAYCVPRAPPSLLSR